MVVERMPISTKAVSGCFKQKPKSTFGDQNLEFLLILCIFYENFMVHLYEHQLSGVIPKNAGKTVIFWKILENCSALHVN